VKSFGFRVELGWGGFLEVPMGIGIIQFKQLQEFILIYNFAKRLKSLKFKTPFEFLVEKFKNNPILFYQNSYAC